MLEANRCRSTDFLLKIFPFLMRRRWVCILLHDAESKVCSPRGLYHPHCHAEKNFSHVIFSLTLQLVGRKEQAHHPRSFLVFSSANDSPLASRARRSCLIAFGPMPWSCLSSVLLLALFYKLCKSW